MGTMPPRGSITVTCWCSLSTESSNCMDLAMFGAHCSRSVTIPEGIPRDLVPPPMKHKTHHSCSIGGDMVHAVVLAGGASRRLGRPKALVPLLGGTVLSVAVERLRAFGLETVVVAHPSLAADAQGLPCRTVINPRPDDGRTGSLHLGLSELGPEVTEVLVCPVDRPGWDASVLRSVLNTPGGQWSRPMRDGQGTLCWSEVRLWSASRPLLEMPHCVTLCSPVSSSMSMRRSFT